MENFFFFLICNCLLFRYHDTTQFTQRYSVNLNPTIQCYTDRPLFWEENKPSPQSRLPFTRRPVRASLCPLVGKSQSSLASEPMGKSMSLSRERLLPRPAMRLLSRKCVLRCSSLCCSCFSST